ncbi:MAG: glycosyl hydrolase family 28-related protein [Opitutaceae bacterium]|nr:glycosyl hydrolase family 28-related protein [Opitutaceae bacterium]
MKNPFCFALFSRRFSRPAVAGLMFVAALLAHGRPASAKIAPGNPVRTETEVREAGRQAVARYADPQLAALGFLDVTKAPYLADPTGRQDATAAIQRALNDARDAQMITYLPTGRYLVSATIEGLVGTVVPDQWGFKGWADPWIAHRSFDYPCVIVGSASGQRATLVLADRAPGFGDAARPKPVLHFIAHADSTPPKPSGPNPTGSNSAPSIKDRDALLPHPGNPFSINFNQKILSLDFDLGTGNPGAVAIDHRGAEGSTIEDVSIQAAGAFAGIQNAPGSGGAMHGIRVNGGRFGLYVAGSQLSPLVSDLTLRDQSEAAILFRGRGALTVVGADIRGAPIRGEFGTGHQDGAINLIDSVIGMVGENPAVVTPRSVVFDNVWFDRVGVVARVADNAPVAGNAAGWTHIVRYAAGGMVTYPKHLGGETRPDTLWVDRQQQDTPILQVGSAAAPAATVLEQHRFPGQPDWFLADTANVRGAPWNAAGDGRQDDTEAIQSAIDASEKVFLPKGTYRISRPLRLRAGTTLFGLTNMTSVITPMEGAAAFADVMEPQPLVETVDDPHAHTMLTMVKLELPIMNPSVYALRWRAGRKSVLRNVYPIRTAWHPDAPVIGTPMIRIEGSGGGRWYTQTLLGWWGQGPDYRHLLVSGTREPLRFYHLQPQHGRSEVMVEMRDVENVDIYSMKCEGNYGLLSLHDSRRVRLFGYSGLAVARLGYSLFLLDNSTDVLLAGIYPQLGMIGKVGALHVGYDPRTCLLLRDGSLTIHSDEEFTYYQLGTPR